jgi:hypothetical protein
VALKPGSKTKKWQDEEAKTYMARVLEVKSPGFLRAKNSAKRRALDLENQESGYYGPRYNPIQGFKFDPNQSKLVPRKLDSRPSSKVGLIP